MAPTGDRTILKVAGQTIGMRNFEQIVIILNFTKTDFGRTAVWQYLCGHQI